MTQIAYAAILAVSILSFTLGLWARPFLSKNFLVKSVAPEELSEFMDRIVNGEEAEARRNEVRRMLHDAGRRTMRTDGGRPAKVHRMRRVRRVSRHPEE